MHVLLIIICRCFVAVHATVVTYTTRLQRANHADTPPRSSIIDLRQSRAAKPSAVADDFGASSREILSRLHNLLGPSRGQLYFLACPLLEGCCRLGNRFGRRRLPVKFEVSVASSLM